MKYAFEDRRVFARRHYIAGRFVVIGSVVLEHNWHLVQLLIAGTDVLTWARLADQDGCVRTSTRRTDYAGRTVSIGAQVDADAAL